MTYFVYVRMEVQAPSENTAIHETWKLFEGKVPSEGCPVVDVITEKVTSASR